MQELSPPLEKRGFAIFFTGLSGSGKTTITSALIEKLQSVLPTRRMTILDGDVVRTHLSKELGFSVKVRHSSSWQPPSPSSHTPVFLARLSRRLRAVCVCVCPLDACVAH